MSCLTFESSSSDLTKKKMTPTKYRRLATSSRTIPISKFPKELLLLSSNPKNSNILPTYKLNDRPIQHVL